MEVLAEAAGWLFGWLLRNSVQASLLAGVVAMLEWTLGGRLPPRWRYGLWLIVVARLLMPVAPESRISLFNLVDFAPDRVSSAARQVLELPVPGPGRGGVEEEPPHPLADTPSWFLLALACWFPGALVLGSLIWRDQRRLRDSLAATTPVEGEDMRNLLAQSKAVMSVRAEVTVEESPFIRSPAVAGWWRPRLLLPEGLLSRLTRDEARFLFLHELAHVKRADIALNWVLAAVQVVHWFNPVVWLALRRLLAVREEVCDDLVLRRSFPGASREYGLTLLRLLEECAPRRVVPSLVGVLDDVRTLRRRIRCIRDFQAVDPNPWVSPGLTVAVALMGLTERWVVAPDPSLVHSPRRPRPEASSVVPQSAGPTVEPAPLFASAETPETAMDPASPEPESDQRRSPQQISEFTGFLTSLLREAALRQQGWGAAPSAGGAGSLPPQSGSLVPARPAGQPVVLPPIRERGDILRPGRSASLGAGSRGLPHLAERTPPLRANAGVGG